MKRRIFLSLLVFIVCFVQASSAQLSQYTDNLDSVFPSGHASYSNLVRVLANKIPVSYIDRTAVTIGSAGNTTGYALYRVENAKAIRITLYTSLGTCAVSDGAGSLMATPFTGQGGGSYTAMYSYSTKKAYAQADDGLYELSSASGRYQKSADRVADLVYYGVNVFVSSDGKNYSRLLQNHVAGGYVAPSCEQVTATIPNGTLWVKVELNEAADMMSAGSNMMASIQFTGDNLIMGASESTAGGSDGTLDIPDSSDSIKFSSNPSSNSSSSSRSSSSSSSKAASSSGGSKFEGVIEYSSEKSSSKSSSAAGSGAGNSTSGGTGDKFTGTILPEDDADTTTMPESEANSGYEPPPSGLQPDAPFYSVRSGAKNNGATLAVVYTVLLLGLGIFVIFKR